PPREKPSSRFVSPECDPLPSGEVYYGIIAPNRVADNTVLNTSPSRRHKYAAPRQLGAKLNDCAGISPLRSRDAAGRRASLDATVNASCESHIRPYRICSARTRADRYRRQTE